MNTAPPNAWYIDVRDANTSEHISLDLTRHLPRRLMVGPAVIIHDQPNILLPVIRKRWANIMREVQRQYSSTLDRNKKQELLREMERMVSFKFTSRLDYEYADAVLISPRQTACELPPYASVYILAPLTANQFMSVTSYALPNSLVAVYGEGWDVYEKALREYYT
ncbi:MAG TPA: hypothetical protein VF809_01875 [Candidatus Saccharimonadales bacterium]